MAVRPLIRCITMEINTRQIRGVVICEKQDSEGDNYTSAATEREKKTERKCCRLLGQMSQVGTGSLGSFQRLVGGTPTIADLAGCDAGVDELSGWLRA